MNANDSKTPITFIPFHTKIVMDRLSVTKDLFVHGSLNNIFLHQNSLSNLTFASHLHKYGFSDMVNLLGSSPDIALHL